MSNIAALSPLDLSIAAFLVVFLALFSFRMNLGLGKQLIIAALRTTIQLLLIGLVLKAVFTYVHLGWITLMALIMLAAAGREVMSRQKRKFIGWWGFGVGTLSMSISSFCVTILALTVIIDISPWYKPQYAIPLLGMLLGNTMNGISIGLDRLTDSAWIRKTEIEGKLMLGYSWSDAIANIRRESIRSGLIPIVNAMSAAGIVSLPGMMTGQILAGNAPMDAVKYQILIMFLIAVGTGFGTIAAIWMGSRRLFDDRHRLRLDRLSGK
ncbi:MAG: iron export ABC transporter permease subunit FetB [Desulfobacterales bacterium]|nr:iron export ABC transporter permease subunit FetB [Desulfobacterales bacterium]